MSIKGGNPILEMLPLNTTKINMADINKMLKEIRERTSPEVKQFIRINMAIVDSVFETLEREKNENPKSGGENE